LSFGFSAPNTETTCGTMAERVLFFIGQGRICFRREKTGSRKTVVFQDVRGNG
jgi:hypothetical protein